MLINDFDLDEDGQICWLHAVIQSSRHFDARKKSGKGCEEEKSTASVLQTLPEVGGQNATVATLAQHVARGEKRVFALMEDQLRPCLCLKLTADYIK